jgi:hypothetical protein
VDEAISTGFGRSDMLVVHAKMLRLELPWDLKHDPRKEALGGTKTVTKRQGEIGEPPTDYTISPRAPNWTPMRSGHVKGSGISIPTSFS